MGVDTFLETHTPLATSGSLPADVALGPWQVVAFLTRGGNGEVYQGFHAQLHIPLALKYAPGDKARRLEVEARLLSTLHHPMFPVVYGLQTTADGAVLAEELLEPYPLPSQDRAVAKLLLRLCEGIAYLHAQGWIHRDLKPSNLMRRKDGQPVIIDLGLAKHLSTATTGIPSDLSLLPNGRAMGVGTPGYAAPEQFSGEQVTTATDIHALGVLVRQCFGSRVPRAWQDILRRATTALPELRYRGPAELARAIRWRHLRKWLLVGTLLLAALGGVGALLLNLFKPETPAEETPPAETRDLSQEKTPMQINHEYFQAYFNRAPGEPPPPVPKRSKLLDP